MILALHFGKAIVLQNGKIEMSEKHNQIKYLEMIQAIINRMASNSFALKAGTVALVSGIFVFASRMPNFQYFFVALIPIIFFWILDSYYLQLERKYRELYNYARKIKTGDEIDFNMDYHKVCIDIEDSSKLFFFNCFFSKSEIFFYIPLFLIVMAVSAIYIILGCTL
ncbi:hypothetical protein LJC08_05590 [Methanimicrococcus sp. OttesenSCG-928-J09]|nr:hypothetical protein [Methanimicrococcus sp. OttesenSCG-928-J09]